MGAYDAEQISPVTLKEHPAPYVFRDGLGLVADMSRELTDSALDERALAVAFRAIELSDKDAFRFVQVYDAAHAFYARKEGK